jgi:hypothetical protein
MVFLSPLFLFRSFYVAYFFPDFIYQHLICWTFNFVRYYRFVLVFFIYLFCDYLQLLFYGFILILWPRSQALHASFEYKFCLIVLFVFDFS